MDQSNEQEPVVDDNQADSQETVTEEDAKEPEEMIVIKQEMSENHMEIDNGNQIIIEQEGIPISLAEFVSYHNEQVNNLKEESSYLSRLFEVMYKYKYIFDMVMEDYFKFDKSFKYRPMIDSLEADLVAMVAEDEEKYQLLIHNVNTDTIMNDENDLEFYEEDDPDDRGDDGASEVNAFNIRKFPGQSTAPPPECPACGLKTRSRLKLEGHLLEHADNPLVVCNHENCEVAFDLHDLIQHEKDYHPEINMICEICNDKFDNKSYLVQHYKLHVSKKEKIRCNFPGCTYSDIYAGRLDRHKKIEHNIEVTKQFRCDFEGCGRIFKDRPSYYTHSLIHKDRSLVYKHKCTHENCTSVFKRRRTLALHMLKHSHVRRQYTCSYGECRRCYSREKELLKHITLVHRNSLKKEQEDSETIVDADVDKEDENTQEGQEGSSQEDSSHLPTRQIKRNKRKNAHDDNNIDLEEENSESQESFSNKSGIQNHRESDMIDDMYQDSNISGTECELCQTNYGTTQELLEHLKDRHHQYKLSAHRCDFQDCTFATHFRSVLGKHKNEVHGGKYKCEVCGKLSKDSGNHNRHRNIHKNIIHRCKVPGCDASYKSYKAYYVHVLTHSNEQPVYSCDHPGCKYVTYYVNTLNVHKLTHSDVRNFFCPFENCNKGFKRNGDLNKHILHSHKGIKRPHKKRRPNINNNNNNNEVHILKCCVEGCNFIAPDETLLSKHEEEHVASETVQEY